MYVLGELNTWAEELSHHTILDREWLLSSSPNQFAGGQPGIHFMYGSDG